MMGAWDEAQDPSVPFFSTVTNEVITNGSDLSAAYFVQNLVSPVKFSTAMSKILHTIDGPKIFLEVGPHSALAGPIRQILKAEASKDEYISVLSRGNDSHDDVLRTVGQMWLGSRPVDLPQVVGPGQFLTDLPLYPWHYEEPLWHESRLAKAYRLREHRHHELLGSRILESTSTSPGWRNVLRLESVPWIKEHEVMGDIVLPGVSYLCMAGEAVRQLTGLADFSCRQVHIKAPMVLVEDKDAEIVTQLNRVSLTNSVESDWYEFSISSHQNGTWIKHAFGQVRSGRETWIDEKEAETKPLPRVCSHKAWYRKFRTFGLEYGPRFSGLKNITTDPVEAKLAASLTNDMHPGDESYYSIHPSTLDCLPQALAPAVFRGLTRRFDKLSLPTYIEEFYLRPLPRMSGDLKCLVEITEERTTAYVGDIVLVSPADEGQMVVKAKGWTVTSISGVSGDVEDQEPHAVVELEWREDIDLLDVSSLIRPANDRTDVHRLLDRFSLLRVAEMMDRLGSNPQPTRPYLAHYSSWLFDLARNIARDDILYGGVSDAASLVQVTPTQRKLMMDDLYAQLQLTEAHAAATAVHRITASCEGIFNGTTDELGILLEDDILHKLYDFMQNSEYSTFLSLLGHKKPNLKVLEIGAGTGGTTATVLPVLKSAYGERMYSSYTYTDVSAGFFPAAKERFKDFAGLDYAILDITKDPVEQGFEAESFDLVIACNVLHATPDIHKTLSHVRKLVHPRGRLFLQELDPRTKWINIIMGVLPGWWLGESDGRFPAPYMNLQRWEEELSKVGFGGVTSVYDGYLNNNIVCSPVRTASRQKETVTLLHASHQEVPTKIEKALQQAGYCVALRTLDDFEGHQVAPTGDIICTLDLSSPFVANMDERQFAQLQRLAKNAKENSCGILWLTGSCQTGHANPAYAPVIGLARVLRTEMQLDFGILELENFSEAAHVVPKVFAEFQARFSEEDVNPESEWAHVSGKTFVSRYHYIKVSQELKTSQVGRAVRKLEQHKPGLASTLYWKPVSARTLNEGEVRVEVRTTGLNFKDVLISLGIITDAAALGEGLGVECAGVVTETGPGVDTLRSGDRVVVTGSGSFTTSHIVSHMVCSKIPDEMSFEEAASIPVTYCTVIDGMLDRGGLRKGMVSGGVTFLIRLPILTKAFRAFLFIQLLVEWALRPYNSPRWLGLR